MDEGVTRRRVAGAGGVVVGSFLSGCILDNVTVAGGRLFVENRSESSWEVSIWVDRQGTGGAEYVVSGRYEIPAEYALEFGDVLETGNDYLIRVRQYIDPPRERVLRTTIGTCDPGGASGRMDVSVFVSDDGPGITLWGCDRAYVYLERLTYVEPAEYRVGPARDTPGSPGAVGSENA